MFSWEDLLLKNRVAIKTPGNWPVWYEGGAVLLDFRVEDKHLHDMRLWTRIEEENDVSGAQPQAAWMVFGGASRVSPKGL